MVRTARDLLLVALFVWMPLSAILAQPPGLPGGPVPPAPQQTADPGPPIPVPPPVDSGPPAGNPPFGNDILPQVNQGNASDRDCLLPATCGFYGLFEISVLFPNISGTLRGPVTVTGMPATTVSLGSAGLESIGSPRLEVGYRFGDNMGAAAVAYRSIVSKGGENASSFSEFGNPFLSSLININVVDIDYVSPASNVAPFWNFSWRAGIRTAGVYYQNQLIGALGQQEATSNFLGAGPHAELELGRALDAVPGLAALAKLDGAVLVGNTSQSFSETLQSNPAVGGASVSNHTEAVPTLTFDIGLSYTPPGNFNWARFGFGYQFEYWWDIGKSGSSSGNLLINGIYFRGEFNF